MKFTQPDEITAIVESVGRYDQSNLPVLEKYVRDQLATGAIDTPANLAVLKLYQFNPPLTNIATVCAILALSLGALPDPDFNLSLCLLGAEVAANKHVAEMVRMQQLLEAARFKEFWAALEAGFKVPAYDAKVKSGGALVKITDVFPAFTNQIRKYITATLSITYQQISLTQFNEYVHLNKKELTEWIVQSGCALNQDDSTLVDFPLISENLPKPALVKENIKFEQLTKIIGVSRISA
ncbi:armadillo-type protein [Chytriomyces sp. MP71]|nr:armadillo-type protein [Chytriomyces sp. MP71]